MFVFKPEVGFPHAAGNTAMIELISVLGYAILANGMKFDQSYFVQRCCNKNLNN